MTIANTASLSTDLNVDPYYDDYDETKNFHRILFRPGFAVQGRELTQMQTLLQNQIDRFGEHIFTEGSIVFGVEQNYDNNYNFVRIRDSAANGSSVTPSSFLNSEITGQTSGVKALVVNTFDGSQANTPDTKTLYVKYTSSSSNNTGKLFVDGEQINSNTGLSANAISANSTGSGSALSVNEGIIFAKDSFIRVPEQTVVIGKYSSNVSARIGFQVNESIVTSTQDNSLLDPARGSFNFAAPGADRLKIDPVLTVLTTSAVSTNNFVDILRIKNGVIQSKVEKPLYSQIKDYVARRTYDESGNYVVEGLNIRIREHLKSANNGGVFATGSGGNTSLLSVDVEPGKAYVYGYDYENIVTRHLPTRKGFDYESVEGLSVPTNYGNYVIVNELVGNWDLGGHDLVSLRDTSANAVSGFGYSTTSAAGSEIGTARIRAIDYVSGTKGSPEAQYRLYLYDITMSSSPFSDVRSIYFNNASISDAKADLVLESGSAVVKEQNFNRAVYPIPAKNIRTIRDATNNIDTNFQFFKSFDVTIATDGTFSISTGASDEQFPFTTGALNATQKSENFFVSLNSAANTAALTGTVSISSGANTISGSGTSFDDEFNKGDRIKLSGTGETFTVSNVASATSMGVLQNASSTASGSAYTKEFEVGQIIDMSGYGSDGSQRSIEVTTTTASSFDIKETLNASVSATVSTKLNKIDGQEIKKTLRSGRYVQIGTANNAANTVGPWNLGLSDILNVTEVRKKGSSFSSSSEGTDVTEHFTFNTGQKDNLYNHGKLVKKPSSSLSIGSSDYLLVKLDYFAHDTSQGVGYFSVDSYPIDDVNLANTNAISTQEIPIFTSPATGAAYSLRDVIDIRPRITDTATNTTSVGSASINPPTSTSIVEPSGGLRYSPPNEEYTIDFDYYLPRIDIVVLDSSGSYNIISGTPNIYPITPIEPEGALTIAKIKIAPYPSLSPELAKRYNRPNMSNIIVPVKNDRYRMRDIGALKNRIDNLEYYTSLSLLETSTKDQKIVDSSGNDRFKNGFIVDNFTGHKIGNVYSPDYKIAIDSAAGEARPTFQVLNTNLKFKSANSSNVTKTGDLITLPYNSVEAINQNNATTTRNAAGLAWSWIGRISLSPDNDSWVETTQRPDVQINFDQNLDNWEFLAGAWGTQWNDWQTTWTGQRVIDTQSVVTGVNRVSTLRNSDGDFRTDTSLIFSNQNTIETTQGQTRTGRQLNIVPDTQTNNLGNRIVDVSVIPFMRSRNVQFTATGLKPNTKLFAFFDGENVSEYITPSNSSFANTANEGGSLVTDASGVAYGIFRIPNEDALRFRVGTKTFRLSDNETNESDLGLVTTAAQTEYFASGVSQVSQQTILSSRVPSFQFDQISETRTTTSTSTTTGPSGQFQITGNEDSNGRVRFGQTYFGSDPIAQTFRIDNSSIGEVLSGVFVSKVDLYFSSKDTVQPVTVEIREVDPSTQYVTNKVVPFSTKTLFPASVNVSADASSATTFTFDSLVYLNSGTDYALVVKPGGDNPNYKVFVARLGDTDISTGNRVVKNPYSGVLFASANDKTWTAIQNEDMKFKVYFAKFTTTTGTAVLENENKDFFTIADVSAAFTRAGEPIHGETTLTLGSSLSANVGEYVVGGTSSANGTVTYSSGTTLRVKDVTTASKYSNGETVTLYFANGIATGASATLSSQATPTAVFEHYDAVNSSNTELHVVDVTGQFVANTYVKSQIDGKTARILNIRDLRVDVVNPLVSKIVPQGTHTAFQGKFAGTTSSLQTSFKSITDNDNNESRNARYILSRSNELSNLSGDRSAQLRVTLNSDTSRYLSPVVDIGRGSLITVENLINGDSTGEDGSSGGNATAKYITRNVTLADGQDAEDMKVFIDAYDPSSSTIEVYYKIIHAEDSDEFDDVSWVQMTKSTKTSIVSDSEDNQDFVELEYTIPTAKLTGSSGEVQYTNSNGVTFTGYKKFAIKIVLLTSNPSNPPRIANFRAIALQI